MSIGITERDASHCTLYCTNLYFGPDGMLLGKHRKMKPTGTERCIWGDGNEGAFTTIDTQFGTIGGLICWENYMPLARAALYQKGVSLYLAPTADNREDLKLIPISRMDFDPAGHYARPDLADLIVHGERGM